MSDRYPTDFDYSSFVLFCFLFNSFVMIGYLVCLAFFSSFLFSGGGGGWGGRGLSEVGG